MFMLFPVMFIFKMEVIDYVELAITSKSKCYCCRKRILKGMPRGCIPHYKYPSHNYLCHECTKRRIEGDIETLNLMIKTLRETTTKQLNEMLEKPEVKKMLIIEELKK